MRLRHPLPAALAAGLTTMTTIPALAMTTGGGHGAHHHRRARAPLSAHVIDRHVPYGSRIVVRGAVHGGGRHGVTLMYRPARAHAWRPVAATTTRRSGRYGLRARVGRSGRVQMRLGGPAQALAADRRPTRPRHVTVTARLRSHRVQLDVLEGHRALVSGHLRPARAGRRVRLQVRRGHRWATRARDRTSSTGRFVIRMRARGLGSRPVRVLFAGDRRNGRSWHPLGRLNVYRATLASWYTGGSTACGGSAHRLGVANKTLPCGTMVTLRYNGRRVRVPVIDRGPYVAGREWDLTAETAARLGFHGVGTVWSTR